MPRRTIPTRIDRRNATFQQWAALLTNRSKRHRAGEMLVQGVRPITMAVEAGLSFEALLTDPRSTHSRWASSILARDLCPVTVLAPELLAELGQRSDGAPELVAVVRTPPDDVARLPQVDNPLIVVFDRPSNPGNIGTLARSVDALGGHALVITGHSADAWDPQAIRASTGSIFAIPVLRLPAPEPLLEWVRQESRRLGRSLQLIGTDESGSVTLDLAPLQGPSVIVIGSEAHGMSSGWHQACDVVARIPMVGTASSLNAAASGSIALYEAARQRASWVS